MCLIPSEGTPSVHLRCTHGVYRELPVRNPQRDSETLQYSSENKPHSRKIMRLIEGRKLEETSGATCEAGPVTSCNAGSTRKVSNPIGHCKNRKDKIDKGHQKL